MLSTIVILFKVCALLSAASYGFGLLLKPQDRRWVQAKPLWLITLALPLAIMLPNIWMLLTLLVILLPAIARDRGEAAALYIIALLALPAMSLPISIGSIWILSLSSYECLSIGLLIASFTLRGGGRAAPGRFDLAIFLLILLNLIASARGLNATSMLREIIGVLLAYALPYWAVRRSITKPQDPLRLMLALSFSGFVLSFIAFYEAKTFWPIYEMVSMHYGIAPVLSQALKVRAGLMRGNATFPESTSFSWLLAICFVTTIVLRARFQSAMRWYGALAAIVVGLLATQARGGWISAILGLVLIDVYRRRWNAAVIKLAVIGSLYGLLSVLSRGKGKLSETMGTSGGASTTVDYRQELMRRGMQEIAKHPWIGTDITTAMTHLKDLRQGEGIIDFVNAYIYYGITLGIFGIIGLLSAFIYAAYAALIVRNRSYTMFNVLNFGALCYSVSIFTALSAFTSGFSGAVSSIYYIVISAMAAAARLRFRGDLSRIEKSRGDRVGKVIHSIHDGDRDILNATNATLVRDP